MQYTVTKRLLSLNFSTGFDKTHIRDIPVWDIKQIRCFTQNYIAVLDSDNLSIGTIVL